MPKQTHYSKELLINVAQDPHRPRYHFLPPAGRMGDPNGLLFWEGNYHLFYQHNPKHAVYNPKDAAARLTYYWGHAVSKDLVYWTHLPIALVPTPGGADKGGCWSGSAVDNNGVPTILYTGVHPQVQCLATSTDGMITWQKHPKNPVVGSPPEGLNVMGFRDPCAWREDDTWYMLIGSGLKDVGGTALLYQSKDLVDWEYLHPLCVGKEAENYQMWECPDFFALGDQHVLLVSALKTSLYFVGTYASHKFTPRVHGNTDFGGQFYAAKTLRDDQGRRIMWGWIREARSETVQQAAGWAGVQSVPRILSLQSDGTLGIEPVPELNMLRGKHQHWTELTLPEGALMPLEGAGGDCLEIIAEFECVDAEEFGIAVRCTPDGTEQTFIAYSNREQCLTVNRERSTLYPDVKSDLKGGALTLESNETLKLHIFLDRSVLEVFANGQICLTSRIYPTRPDSLGVAPFANGGEAKLKSLEIWKMESIWPASGS